MPLFYLHLLHDRYVADLEGTCFDDLAAARDEAIATAREFMSQQILRTGRICLHHRIKIEDEQGILVQYCALWRCTRARRSSRAPFEGQRWPRRRETERQTRTR